MSSCAGVEGSLVDYLDGELVPPERAAFDAHLAGCAECREAVEAYRGFRAAYRQGAEEDAGDEVAARVLALSREPVAARPRASLGRRPAVWILAAAACVLFALGLVPLLRTLGGDRAAAEASALLVEGDALRDAGELGRAAETYEHALARDPAGELAATLLHRLGTLEVEAGDHGAALERFALLLDTYPGYARRDSVLLEQAHALEDIGRLDAALVAYERYLREFPDGRSAVAEHLRELVSSRELAEELRTQLNALGYTAED